MQLSLESLATHLIAALTLRHGCWHVLRAMLRTPCSYGRSPADRWQPLQPCHSCMAASKTTRHACSTSVTAAQPSSLLN